MKKTIYLFLLSAFIMGLICNSSACIDGASNAMFLCARTIIPSLFPFFVVSKMFTSLGLSQSLGGRFQDIMRPLFGVPGCGSFALIIGIVSGYPVGAQTVLGFYNDGLCDKTEAQRMLGFCNNSGPLFIIGIVGTMMLSSFATGVILYIAHILSALTVAFMFKFYKRHSSSHSPERRCRSKTLTFTESFTVSILESVKTTLFVCGFIIFFAVLIEIIKFYRIIPMLEILLMRLGFEAEIAKGIIIGILEITTGLESLTVSGASLPIINMIITFSGIGVIMQVSGIISNSGLSLKIFIAGKVIQGLLAGLYTFLLQYFVSARPVFLQTNKIHLPSMASVFENAVSIAFITILLYVTCSMMKRKKN